MCRELSIHLTTAFSGSFEWFAKEIRLEQFPELYDEAEMLYESARHSLMPQSIHTQAFIDSYRINDTGIPSVEIDGITFTGKILNRLHKVHRVFPYIATCGIGLEDIDPSTRDFLVPYWIDILKSKALRIAQLQLETYLTENYHLHRINSLNPGSGNVDIWPIEEMPKVFTLLHGGKAVGVKLTDSCLMIPNKTISGLFFAQDRIYESCTYCTRKNCPDRRTPFEQKL